MTTINNNINTYLDTLRKPEQSAVEKAEELNKKELEQEDFFSLMTQQLAFQDPFKPVENAEMVAQMTAFSTAEGIASMGESLNQLNSIVSSSQALQASSLVGRSVLIENPTAHLDQGDTLEGRVVSEQPIQELKVRVETPQVEVLRVLNMGPQDAGSIKFSWDGKNAQGNPMPSGSYALKASAMIGDKSHELPTATYQHVESVSLGNLDRGVVLNLKGMGSTPLANALEVGDS